MVLLSFDFLVKNAQKIALAVAFLLCAGMWRYVDRVLIVHQQADATARSIPRGNLSDLYPSWLASRELLLNHRDPYSRELTREIQMGYYGRALDPARKNDPKNQQAFAYPVYVAFLLSPTVKLPFAEVQIVFRWFLALLTVVSVILWLRVIRWQHSFSTSFIVVLLIFSTFPVVQGIKMQQLSLLVAPLIAGCIYLLAKGKLVPAGIFLALAMIKPQLSLPLAAWLVLWSLSRPRLRWKFAVSFAVTMLLLVRGGEFLLPGWVHEFANALKAYLDYNGTRTLMDELFTRILAVPIELSLAAIVAILCWRNRKKSADSGNDNDDFFWITSLVLAATVVLIPTIAPYNQLLLLPGAFLLLRTWSQPQQTTLLARIFRGTTAACVIWSWITATSLALASFLIPSAHRLWQIPLWTSVLLPLPLTASLIAHFFQPEVQIEAKS